MKRYLQSADFDEKSWELAIDNINKDTKINYAREKFYSFDINYTIDQIKIIEEIDRIKHITNGCT